MSDATVLLRDIAGDAAQNAAGKINPSDDQLRQMDAPAEDNTWHEVPDLSKDNIKAQAKAQYDKQKPFGKTEAKDTAQKADQSATNPDGTVDGTAGTLTAADDLQAKAKQNIPDETQDKAKEYREKTQNYFKNKVPKDRREQTVFRLKKMVVEIQGHQDCK